MRRLPIAINRLDMVAAHMGANMACIADGGDSRYRDFVWDVRQTLEGRANRQRLEMFHKRLKQLNDTDSGGAVFQNRALNQNGFSRDNDTQEKWTNG